MVFTYHYNLKGRFQVVYEREVCIYYRIIITQMHQDLLLGMVYEQIGKPYPLSLHIL